MPQSEPQSFPTNSYFLSSSKSPKIPKMNTMPPFVTTTLPHEHFEKRKKSDGNRLSRSFSHPPTHRRNSCTILTNGIMQKKNKNRQF